MGVNGVKAEVSDSINDSVCDYGMLLQFAITVNDKGNSLGQFSWVIVHGK